MCLILAAWKTHPDYPLIVAANRDEHFDRSTAAAQWWSDAPDLLAGQDLLAGGTWLGMSRSGRFAALTNYRDPRQRRANAPSRGLLVRNALLSSESTPAVLEQVSADSAAYAAFNLLVSDGRTLGIHESASGATRILPPGIHGLSNHLLGTPWPKLQLARERFALALDHPTRREAFVELLRDSTPANDDTLPDTGIGIEWERQLSSVFVRAPGYGTRSSTLVRVSTDDAVDFTEWTWNQDGELAGEVHHCFRIKRA